MSLSQDAAPRRVDPGAVQALVAEALGEAVPEDGSFIGHGGDSFHAVVVVSRIEEEWGVEIDFLEVLDSTPASLADAVSAALADRR
jgi:acyl carrier protein